jgi:uncharacterized protein YkwD
MFAAEAPVQPVHAHAAANRVQIAIVRALNRARAPYGLPRLRMTRGLNRVAGAHSQDLAVHGMFSHSSSDGTSFADRIRRVTGARLVGETLIELAGRATGNAVVSAWMNSPPHRADILMAGFRHVGVGTARQGGMVVVTADFTG